MTAVELARALLPSWIGWAGPVAYLVLASLLSALAAWIGTSLALVGMGRVADAHWSVRARASFPGRSVSALCLIGLPLMFAVFGHLWAGPLSIVPWWLLSALTALGCLVTISAVHLRVLRRLLPKPLSWSRWLSGALVVWLVIRPVLPLVLLLALLAPEQLWDLGTLLWLLLAVATMAGAARGWGLGLGRVLGVVRPASPRLRRIVEAAAVGSGVTPRGVYELGWPMANAAAFPASQMLVFSDTALAELEDAELEAVAAHELGHLAEPGSVLLLRLGQMAMWIPLAAVRPVSLTYGTAGYGAVLLCVVLVMLGLRRTMRRMEQRADQAAKDQEVDPGAYARALEKLYRVNAVPAVLWRGTTHPHLYDRLVTAGVEPDFERPAPPARARMYGGLLAALLTSAVLLLASTLTPLWLESDDPAAEWPQLVWLATGHGGAWELGAVADVRADSGRVDEAIVLYRAAVELDPESVPSLARLTYLLASAGRCHEARATAARLVGLPTATADDQAYAAEMAARCQAGLDVDP